MKKVKVMQTWSCSGIAEKDTHVIGSILTIDDGLFNSIATSGIVREITETEIKKNKTEKGDLHNWNTEAKNTNSKK